VSLDPGIHSFMTFYSPKFGAGTKGDVAANKFYPKALQAQKLFSKARLTKDPRRKKAYRNAAYRINNSVRRLRKELHCKPALWLVTNFDVIVLPHFHVQQIASKKLKRRLKEKTIKQMLSLGHYKFLKYLKAKAEETGVELVYEFDEAYTPITCSCCEWMDK
jgi:putative transposase